MQSFPPLKLTASPCSLCAVAAPPRQCQPGLKRGGGSRGKGKGRARVGVEGFVDDGERVHHLRCEGRIGRPLFDLARKILKPRVEIEKIGHLLLQESMPKHEQKDGNSPHRLPAEPSPSQQKSPSGVLRKLLVQHCTVHIP